jgi:hypothetical protein
MPTLLIGCRNPACSLSVILMEQPPSRLLHVTCITDEYDWNVTSSNRSGLLPAITATSEVRQGRSTSVSGRARTTMPARGLPKGSLKGRREVTRPTGGPTGERHRETARPKTVHLQYIRLRSVPQMRLPRATSSMARFRAGIPSRRSRWRYQSARGPCWILPVDWQRAHAHDSLSGIANAGSQRRNIPSLSVLPCA